MPYTRLGAEGYGVRQTGSFNGKVYSGAVPDPAVQITRLGQFGVMVENYAGFVAKSPAVGAPFVPRHLQPDLHGNLHSLQGNFQ